MKLIRILAALSLPIALYACGSSEDSGNPPDADFSFTCTEFVCDFDASASMSRGGSLSYLWDFGDEQGTVSGRQVRYAFLSGGDFTVELTVQSSNGQSDRISKTVSVTDNEAAEYYVPVHDTARLLILVDDYAHTIYENGDFMQDEAESNGATSAPGYTEQCPENGTYSVSSWSDSNGNNVVDNGEALAGSLDECKFISTGETLDSRDGFTLTNDFDATTFSFGTSNNATDSLRLSTYPEWSLRGNINFSTSAPGGTTVLAYDSSTSQFNRFNDAGRLTLSVGTQVDLQSSVDRLSEISGTASFDLVGTVFGLSITDPVTLTDSGNGFWNLQQGTVRIAAGSDWIYISPDPDPAYITVEVDLQRNGVINITDRFPQSLVFHRLE